MSTIITPQSSQQPRQQAESQRGDQPHQDLQSLNPIILLKQPQLFKQTFDKITRQAHQCFKQKDFQKGQTFYNKAIDMLDLGKNILKQHISKYLKLTIFLNLAYGYQNLRKLQKASRFSERAKEELERLIETAKREEHSIEKYLKLSKFFVTLKFQHCAIVSQLQQHEKALQICKSTLPQLKQHLQTMLNYLKQTSSHIKPSEKKSCETVQFSRHVQKFSSNMLQQLLSFLEQPLKKFHFYYWEKNPQLNQQQVRKKFISPTIEAKNQCKRSILGVSKTTSWMDQFNIGSIMHMNMATVQQFQVTLPIEEYFFKDKLYEIVILCSLSYFTMATEIRFLQSTQQNQAPPKQNSPLFNSLGTQSASQLSSCDQITKNQKDPQETQKRSQIAQSIFKKYGYQERTQMHKLSQMYHLRSIQIVSRHIQTAIPYLLHIIKSYDKHYLKKKELQPIAAIAEESQMSMINESVRQYAPEEKIYGDYLKESLKKNQEPMGELLLQSYDRRPQFLSRNKLQTKITNEKNTHQYPSNHKHIPEFNLQPEQSQTNNNLGQSKNYFNYNLSKIIQDPIKQTETHPYPKASQQNNYLHHNQLINGQYLKSKRTMHAVKSPKLNKNQETKRTKSKSKLKFIKSPQKIPKLKNNQKSSHKNIYTYRSPKEEKRSVSRSQHQPNKNLSSQTGQELMIKKYHSPDLGTINQSKKRLKTNLTDRSKEKLLKKFIEIPKNPHQDSQKHTESKGAKKPKPTEKKSKNLDDDKRKQSKYFSTFDGQKQYRIKHETTTHIKVLYKKKNNQQVKQNV